LQVYPELFSYLRDDYELIVDMDGNVVNGFFQPERSWALELINSTTVFFVDSVSGNYILWNIYTNETEYTDAPSGHHDAEYNPETETFLVIESVYDQGNYVWSGQLIPIKGDDIVEYDKDGNEIWRWQGRLTFPFDEDEWLLRTETLGWEADWMHSNSLYWDLDEDVIYLCVRHLDCVVKVDYATGNTIWVAGRYTGEGPELKMYNLAGEEVDTLYYHPHAVEKIAPNTLLLFDNDYWNPTRLNPQFGGISAYREFVYDEDSMTANETWSWEAPEEYYEEFQGDADRLPNGNTVGVFDLAPRPIITEVNAAGEIVWEWILEPIDYGDQTYGWGVTANGFMRFLESPGIEIVGKNVTPFLDMNVWEVAQFRYSTNGTVRVLEGTNLLTSENFTFIPHWQVTPLSISVPELGAGQHSLTIQIENQDGMMTSLMISTINSTIVPNTTTSTTGSTTSSTTGSITIPTTSSTTGPDSNLFLYGFIAAGAIVCIFVIVLIFKKGSA